MILLGTHIYDSTMADKNAIVPNALQFSLEPQDNTEGAPVNLINNFELYYNDKLVITFNTLPFIYYFSKDYWQSLLDVNDKNYYCNLEKFKVKWVEDQEVKSVNGEAVLRLLSWDNSLILSHNNEGLEVPDEMAQAQQAYSLGMRASSLSISSNNPAHSDWTPKLIDYHYWRNRSEDYYIDIPIAPLVFPLDATDFTINLKLFLQAQDKQFEILSLNDLSLVEDNGDYFLKEVETSTYKISYSRTNAESRITATHILISEFNFSQCLVNDGVRIADLLDGRLYLTLAPVGPKIIEGIKDFKYLTCFNLIFKEAPYFHDTDLISLEWTLDQNDSSYPFIDFTDYSSIYNAGSTIKVNISKSLELCGRPLSSFSLYESLNGKDYTKTRVINSQDNSEIIFTLQQKTTTENIYFAFGATTVNDTETLTTSNADFLKLTKPIKVGRIVKPQVRITSCSTSNNSVSINLAVDDYGGDNKGDSNLISYCENSEQFWSIQNLQPTCIVEIFKSLSTQFNGQPIKTITLTGPYNENDWIDIADLELSEQERLSTIYLKARITFTYGCQDNIDMIVGETPIFTFLGLDKLPTVSYLKNQVGLNTPSLQAGDLLNISAVDQKALINFFNGATQYSSINVNSRNLNEFIINCGNWDDAEFGYSNFKAQIQSGRTLFSIAVGDITESVWNISPLFLKVPIKKMGTNITKYITYSYINNLQKSFSEKDNILQGVETVYTYTNAGVEQFNDINQQKLTVQE